MNRRDFLKAALAGAATLSLPNYRAFAAPAVLLIGTRTLDVNGRAATVHSLLGPDGRPGLTLDAGTDFDVVLRNGLSEETMIHWHGLTPPWDQDGVPGLPTPILGGGAERSYRFPVGVGGTHWMHAHTLQEQNLLAAPLIVRTAEDRAADEQEVVVLLHDFSFTPAAELLARLQRGDRAAGHGGMAPMNHGSTDIGAMSMPGMDHGAMGGTGAMDFNDIAYDAYLANDRTLDDPEVVRIETGVVRLRIINGATATAFTIDLGAIEGDLIAVDGQAVVPVRGRRFPTTMGQRIDLRIRIPVGGGAFPVLALREGAPERTGIVLATAGAAVAKLPGVGDVSGPVLGAEFEMGLRAAKPLIERAPDQTAMVHLGGDMATYRWGMMGIDGLTVRKGQRVEITMMNMSMMAHPMHLHGHHLQVVAVDGQRFAGAVRDTVLVPPMRAVTIAVDTDNPGRWAFHCHHLYHMAAGTMASFAYVDVA
ncbi:multicopper oxidase family protein [Chthonobacter albigriseus]|uniref:multicopper oxidase family protein n=1 Tax=Chthonobacter albigriseus TaxID=1683161 RepID=UPI0015EE844D|nr:multicopper oxidase family protein [Chthonobacter albigriseus]